MSSIEPAYDHLELNVAALPTTHTLAAIMAVLHSRAADVRHLTWTTSCDGVDAAVTLSVAINPRRRPHLEAALLRIIGVTSVELAAHATPPATGRLSAQASARRR